MYASRFVAIGSAALALGLAIAPLSAAGARDLQADPGQQQYWVKKSDDGKKVEYCTKLPPVTGSRLATVVCKTAKQWAAIGVKLNLPS